ncbi:O-methyltransferase [Haloarchaeobius amylolyticus]|uniref:O-methyltransferase n=1 Tax=Haloarchaeobius amylolyticus TaxID=1198296 RepID=UPI00226F3941|nr:O-methyltransferase [Haloarchaeobius amylolyticus]
MAELHAEAVGGLIEWAGPAADEVLEAMTARAERDGFPTVGPEVGRALALCTRLSGARSVLELGSGFGYSAYWVARALPPDGRIVLTERDGALLADARAYFERGDLADRATFEQGDALDIAEARTDTFDLVVLDHDTADYVAGFEAARDLVAPGGAILVDNVAVYGDVLTPDGLLATLDGEEPPNDRTRVVAEFLTHLRQDDAFETYLLPVGEGLAVATRVQPSKE